MNTNSKISKVSSFRYKRLTDYLEQRRKILLNELAPKSGKIFGERELPTLKGDTINSYIGDIKSYCESTIAYIDEHLQSQSLIPEYNSDKIKVEEAQVKAKIDIDKLLHDIGNLKIRFEDFDGDDLDQIKKLVIGFLSLICIAETIFNSIAFQGFGENKLFSLIIGLSITVGIFGVAHGIGTYVKKIKNVFIQRAVIIGVLVCLCPVFFVLGHMRSSLLANQGILSIGTWSFVILNYFYFLATSFMSYIFWPTKEERRSHKVHQRHLFEIQSKEKEIKVIEQNVINLKNALHEKAIEINDINYTREYIIESETKSYNEAVALFIKNNILYRPDRKTPDCFSSPIPKLDIKNNFNYYKPNQEEDSL